MMRASLADQLHHWKGQTMQGHVDAIREALLDAEKAVMAAGNKRAIAATVRLHRALHAAANANARTLGVTVEPLSGGIPKDD